MGILKKTEWTEKLIQEKLKVHFLSPGTKKYEITNLYVFDWESDYLAITQSGLFYEVEIKISRADFKNDFKNKGNKHLILEHNPKAPYTHLGMPNYFYYAVPAGLIKAEEVPDYAGLIYVRPWGVYVEKEAKKLHADKLDLNKLKIYDKFYYNMLNWQSKYDALADANETIKKLKKEIKGLNKTVMYYDEELSNLNGELYEANLKIQKLEDEIRRRDT